MTCLQILTGERAARPDRAAVRRSLSQHRLYARLGDPAALRRFMEHHVFAVWDFVNLLQSLERDLGVDPAQLADELASDEDLAGIDRYVEAMRSKGADPSPVLELSRRVDDGSAVKEAVLAVRAPVPAIRFLTSTSSLLEHGGLHERASALLQAREGLIPPAIAELVGGGDPQSPLLERLLDELCGTSATKRAEADAIATSVLTCRLIFWDAIHASLDG